ncbi:DUF5998 family protein [Luteococcus sp. H138]|uniref:DUF5998 family protein n=1 Tax=unclassified Luteococcus TaxID=2639923 RepID=UPI00313D628C
MNPVSLPTDLRREIDDCGYFPEFIADSVALALGDERVVSHLVHHEASFANDQISRHVTVIVVTQSRLLVVHTDDGPATDALGRPTPAGQAITSCEAMPLSNLGQVSLSRSVSAPQHYGTEQSQVIETWLTLGWGTMRRLDLEPASCADPTCEADHGYTGNMVGDDITIRMSAAADGADKVTRLVDFATGLQRLTGRAQ